jgi:hypothetical protein
MITIYNRKIHFFNNSSALINKFFMCHHTVLCCIQCIALTFSVSVGKPSDFDFEKKFLPHILIFCDLNCYLQILLNNFYYSRLLLNFHICVLRLNTGLSQNLLHTNLNLCSFVTSTFISDTHKNYTT